MKTIAKMDKTLLFLMIIFSVFGLIMIFSASSVSTVLRYHVPQYYFFLKQAIFLIMSFIIGIVVLNMPTSKYKYFSFLLIVAIIGALTGLFIYGKMTNHAQSWYDLKLFNLQPSEFAKSILIVYMADYFNRLTKKKKPNIYLVFFPLSLAIIICLLVFMQPDLGSALIIGGISVGIFFAVPIVRNNMKTVLKVLVFGLLLGIIALLVLGKDLLNSRQLERFNFQNPCERYQQDSGYQVCNGFIAINNGSIFGSGLGNSTQKYLYLPESHTDMIFPIIVEELGLVTGIVVILLYAVMLYRIFKIAKRATSLRGSILAYGTLLYILLHILINLMGILALIPLTGVPLPFLSYGGSFTINVVVMLFVVQRVAIENNDYKDKKIIKKIKAK